MRKPDTEFGGWFLGNPGMDFLSPTGEQDGGLTFAVFSAPLARPGCSVSDLRLGIRPEYVRVHPFETKAAVRAHMIRRTITIGGQVLLTLAIGETRLKAKLAPDQWELCNADAVAVECLIQHAVFFRAGARLPDKPRILSAATVPA